MLQHVTATRYVTPLREGGSLPGIVEADDLGTYVVKFRGAGQGSAALVSEIVVGELGRRLGVRVPDLVLIALDAEIGKREPDQEVQELLLASVGVNLGMDFLPGSIGYDGIHWQPPAEEAARIFWLDALTGNVDRTWANPNMLIWHRKLWAIDHGAALVFQHSWPAVSAWASQRRRTASAQQQASTIVASRAGPAATFVFDKCGASDVHAVGWLITGEFGWLVTEVYVACQLASAAAPSSTTDGRADLTRNAGIRRHGRGAS